MAWRTGFVRLWLVSSVLWCVIWLYANGIDEKAYRFASSDYLSTNMTSEDIQIEYLEEGVLNATVIDVRNAWLGDNWWMDSPRILEIDTSGVSEDMSAAWGQMLEAIVLEFNQQAAIHNAGIRKQGVEVLYTVSIAILVPLATLIFGAAIGWILSGFRKRQ